MFKFESFVGKKKVEDYNTRLLQTKHAVSEIGVVENHKMYKVVINPDATKTIGFIAGIHGDEPAGPLGVLKLLESNFHFPKSRKVVIIPLANPSGYEQGTRDNYEGIDINRQFDEKQLKDECKIIWDALKNEGIELLHTLHEDDDLEEFYLYHTEKDELAGDLRDLATKYFSVVKEGRLYDDLVMEGLIPLPHKRRGTIEDRVYDSFIPYITTETPGKASLKKRVDYTVEAIKMSIYGF